MATHPCRFPTPGSRAPRPPSGGVGAGEVTVLDLPASGWSAGTSVRRGFKFKSRSGAVVSARLVEGRSIRISARGDSAYPLGGTPQGGVGIIVDVGGVRFCGFFGGTIVKDDGERFVARKAPRARELPHPGNDDHLDHDFDHDDDDEPPPPRRPRRPPRAPRSRATRAFVSSASWAAWIRARCALDSVEETSSAKPGAWPPREPAQRPATASRIAFVARPSG